MEKFLQKEQELLRMDQEIDNYNDNISEFSEYSDSDTDLLQTIIGNRNKHSLPKENIKIENSVNEIESLETDKIPKQATTRLQQCEIERKDKLVSKLQAKIALLEQDKKQFLKEIRSLRISQKTMENRKNLASGESNGLKVRVIQLEKSNKDLEASLRARKKKINSLEREKKMIDVNLKKITNENNIVVTMRNKSSERVRSLNTSVSDLTKKIQGMNTQLIKLKEENKSLNQQVKYQFEVLKSFKTQVNHLQALKMLHFTEKQFEDKANIQF